MKKIDLPSMVRVSQLAEFLSMTSYDVLKLCERNGVPIAYSGARKIKMISRDKFFEKLEGRLRDAKN